MITPQEVASPLTGVRVFRIDLDQVDISDASIRACGVDESEMRSAETFVLKRDRDRYLATRAGVRCVLASHLGCSPVSLSFGVGREGKPYLKQGGVNFNLSHGAGHALVAVARAEADELGIDIEIDDGKPIDDLFDRVLTETEIRRLRTLPASDQRRAFFQYWTLKEAVLKAHGEGLQQDPRGVELEVSGDRKVGISKLPDGYTAEHKWELCLLDAGVDKACAAVAVRRKRADAKLGKRTPRRHDGSHHTVPLTRMQQGMLFSQMSAPGNIALNLNYVFDISGHLNAEAMTEAFRRLVCQHPVLRLGCRFSGNGLSGFLWPEDRFVLDCQSFAGEGVEAAEAALRAFTRKPFLVTDAPMARLWAADCGDGRHLLCLSLHHAVSDGDSVARILADLSSHYAAVLRGGVCPGAETRQWNYLDYAASQERWIGANAFDADLEWWARTLAACTGPVALPFDWVREHELPDEAALVGWVVDAELLQRLRDLGRSAGCSLFVVLLSIFKLMLGRYGAAEQVTVGIPTANRFRPEFRNVVGPMLNTLPVTVLLNEGSSFMEHLRNVGDAVGGALAHGETPFELLIERLSPPRDSRGNVWYDVLFNHHKVPLQQMSLDGCECSRRAVHAPLDPHSLSMETRPEGNQLRIDLHYDPRLFQECTVKRMLDRYRTLLRAILEDPWRSVTEIEDWVAEEKERVLCWSRGPRPSYPRQLSLGEAFSATAARYGDRIAVIDGARRLSFRDLDLASNQLARLLGQRGVVPGSVCGLFLDRSADFVVAILSILKAGAAYMPLDAELPWARLVNMLEESGAVAVIHRVEQEVDDLPSSCSRLQWDDLCAGASAVAVDDPGIRPEATGCASLMFTSGSTGKPKAIGITHRGIVRLILGAEHNRLTPDDVCVFSSAVSFDASTWEIWAPLLGGATMVVLPSGPHDAVDYADIIRAHGVTHLSLTTALLQWVVEDKPAALRGLKAVITGGEALPVATAVRFCEQLPGTTLVNCYGPTENTVDTTVFEMSGPLERRAHSVPIGRPVGQTDVFVLNRRHQLCGIGMVGELWTSGDGLALGYRGQPGLTRERFHSMDRDFLRGVAYNTGDLCRWREDGNLVFIGRADEQVKIRGHRIEPGEIERVLCLHPGAGMAAVVVCGIHAEERHLLAVVERRSGADAPTVDALREHCLDHLPGYMVPARIAVVERLPLTGNGKVDRKALVAIGQGMGEARAVDPPPVTGTEGKVIDLWAQILPTPPRSPEDDFFGLGGNSILALRLLAHAERVFGVSVSLTEFTRATRVADFARLIAAADDPARRSGFHSSLVPIRTSGSGMPMVGAYGHAFHSSPFIWRRLSAHLPEDIPVYGIMGFGLDGSRVEADRLESLAQRHADEIAPMARAHGVILAGYCAGGYLALEILRCLQREGIRAGHLVLVDSLTPAEVEVLHRRNRQHALRRRLGLLRERGPADLGSWILENLKIRLRMIRQHLAHAKVARMTESEPVPHALRQDYMLVAQEKLFTRYVPRPIEAHLHLIRSERTAGDSFDYGWSEWFRGPVDVHLVPLPHQMMEDVHIADLAETFSKILRHIRELEEDPVKDSESGSG